MRPTISRVAPLLTVGTLLLQTGCQSGAGGASVLSLFGLSKRPVVIALVAEPGILNPFGPYEKLRKAMSESIERPVRLDLCLSIQLEPNLDLGFYDFACVTPAQYAAIRNRERFKVIATSLDEPDRAGHAAVLVVASDAKIVKVEDLRRRTVAFGPQHDTRTHHAGLVLLREHGLERTDLSLSLLPIPGSLKHFARTRDIAQSVINGSSDAGFVDELAFEALPPGPGGGGEPTRDKLRVIARTMPLPETLLIRSPKAKAETVRRVTEFLLTVNAKHPEALRPLLFSAYGEPSATLLASCQRLAAPRGPAPGEREAGDPQ